MNIWKYLPRKFRRKIRKEIARRKIHGEMVETLYAQRDSAIKDIEGKDEKIKELESKVSELARDIASYEGIVGGLEKERNYYRDAIQPVIKAARKVKRAREDSLAEILIGDRSPLDPSHEKPSWLNEAIIRVAKGLRNELDSSKIEIEELRKDHLSEIIGIVGGYERIERVPLAVYQEGDFIYETEVFEKIIRSNYILNETLKNDKNFLKAINKNKKVSVKYEEGKLFFVPEKLGKRRSVAIAYYVPEGTKLRRKIFRTQGEKAIKAIYKTLKSFDKEGKYFMNDGNQ